MKIEQKKSVGKEQLICIPLMEKETPPKEMVQSKIGENRFRGKTGQVYSIDENGRRILLVGLGEKEKYRLDNLRVAGGTCARYARNIKESGFSIVLSSWMKDDEAKAIAEGLILGNFEFRELKSEKDDKDDFKGVENVHLVSKSDVSKGIGKGMIYAAAQNYSRRIDEHPANLATPIKIAEIARKLAKEYGMAITVFDTKGLKDRGMEGILAVGKGSAEPPVLVKLEYNYGKKLPLYCIVGKGITFDSGGIDLKPSKNMHEMKYDKTGAVNVLGIMMAVAELKLPIRLIGLMPLAENVPSGTAQKPGDIIRIYNGKTVEVLNTDAEGRLVLADALSYACEQKPRLIIDMATLTGAIVVCLGRHAAGLFSNDDGLAKTIEEAGIETHERVWRLPLWQEYTDMMKSEIADLKNISDTPEAGSVTAAVFLQEFIKDTKWAHLDIASVDHVSNSHGYLKGATCIGVRLVTRTLEKLSKDTKNKN